MAETAASPPPRAGQPAPPQRPPASPFKRWLLQGHLKEIEGPYEREDQHHTHPWWQVMCLTGVDYFSTLGYQPGIAALAAQQMATQALSPIATLILVLLTLFGALPMYKRVASESPHGDGSISMLERLLSWWQGKLFVLCLIGFAATGFIITITLSAADATAHIIENPYAPHFLHGQEIAVTFLLILMLGAVFLKGFGEAIGIAVALVALYIGMNLVVIGAGLHAIWENPSALSNWGTALTSSPRFQGNPFLMVGFALLLFPKLALGLSGFETGVVVMPLVKGGPDDTPENPQGRIRNTHKLLTVAALIMSVLLIGSSVVTSMLIPPAAFTAAAEGQAAGEANGRALAYLAHHLFGDAFGTVYDISTVLILWFAGSSAMAGLLNIVPRYLPRYGMAPDWTRAVRPLVLIYTGICLGVTFLFKAEVEAQAGAYATGVLALMTSATIAVTLSVAREGRRGATVGFGLVTLIFIYTTLVNVIEQPEGLKIAMFFIAAIVVTSLISRVFRSTELRVERIELDRKAQIFLREAAAKGPLRIIANRRQSGDPTEYRLKEKEQREDNHIPHDDLILFLEVDVADASEFANVMEVKGVEIRGDQMRGQIRGMENVGYRILRAQSSTVPNAIAAFLLHLRDTTGKMPHVYFSWSEGNPIVYLMRFVLFGEGDTAPVTREVLRKAEPDPERRPVVHAGG